MSIAPSQQPISANRSAPPVEGTALAYAAVGPLLVAGIASLSVPAGWHPLIVRGTIVWGAAIVSFLAGVRRGDSFHTPGGPSVRQRIAIFGTFSCAVLALISPWPNVALLLVIAGFGAIGLLDTAAANSGEAPSFFARLRPTQTIIAIIAVLAVLAASLTRV